MTSAPPGSRGNGEGELAAVVVNVRSYKSIPGFEHTVADSDDNGSLKCTEEIQNR